VGIGGRGFFQAGQGEEGSDDRRGEGFEGFDVFLGQYDDVPGESVTDGVETASLLAGDTDRSGTLLCV